MQIVGDRLLGRWERNTAMKILSPAYQRLDQDLPGLRRLLIR